ncbi:ABC transporter substrate-binding protein [Puniceibacterium sediminis]|uniref:Peptide/nickel transport system substrate-binding protein n=1 Tax=Puniceibacterium sediminis TaxID=1608407 RepID=A0A238Y9A4_9RHOB|nr:ABC transporter substrate-binding protein [Puniceibacterium sediminis]SNR67717.1 peptide/nickel transport system substrate-binding protein [Puniceibacterium sediminis]
MTTRLNRRGFLASTGALAGGLAFLGPRDLLAQEGGTLRFALSTYPPSFDAWASSGTAAGTIKLLIHRGLLGYAPDGTLRGELAESWKVDDTGAWIFKLRDAKWHDGTPVTAEDIAWNVLEAQKSDSAAHFQGQLSAITSVETPDTKTVRMVTTEPLAVLPGWFADFNMPMIKKGEPRDTTLGAGPFTLASTDRGVSLSLKAWEGYYKEGLPKLSGIEAIVYADENLRVAALEAGDVDLIEYVPWQSMTKIEGNDELTLQTTNGPFMYLTFNGSRPPFDNPKVRQAVAHAIKREDIAAAAFYDRGGALEHLPIPEGSEFYNPEFKDAWNYDPDKATALLAEAGYPDGFECTMLSTAQYGMHQSTAEVCQAYLSMIGINVQLDLPEWSTRVQKGNEGSYDLAVMGTAASNNDPDGLSSVLDGSLPASFVRSFALETPEISALFAKGRATFDTEERKAIYKEMEKIAIDTTPMVGLSWRSQGYAMKSGVSGFTSMPGQLIFYSGTTLEETMFG